MRVRQHQENMWLGGLRRDRAVDQQESHTERPHRRHIMIDIVAAARSRRPRPGPPPRGNSAAVLLFSQPALAAVDIPPAGSSCRPAGAAAPPPQKLGSGTRRKTPKTAPGRRVHLCAKSSRATIGRRLELAIGTVRKRTLPSNFRSTVFVPSLSRQITGLIRPFLAGRPTAEIRRGNIPGGVCDSSWRERAQNKAGGGSDWTSV